MDLVLLDLALHAMQNLQATGFALCTIAQGQKSMRLQDVRTKFRNLAHEEPARSADDMAAAQAADVRARATLNFNKLGIREAKLLSHTQLQALVALLSAPQVAAATDAAALLVACVSTGGAPVDTEALRARLRPYARAAPGNVPAVGAAAPLGSDADVTARILAAVQALQGGAGAAGSAAATGPEATPELVKTAQAQEQPEQAAEAPAATPARPSLAKRALR
jgi:hypothetical protein